MRISWVTNNPAPYRLPVWDALGSRAELDVLLLEDDSRFLRKTGNRGDDWVSTPQTRYRMRHQPTWRLKRGESDYYVSRAGWFSDSPDVVLLGGWESPAYFQALASAKRKRIPTVGFYESHLRSQGHAAGPIASARSSFFRRLDAVVTPGVAAAEALYEMGVPAEKVLVGFNAVDVDWIARLAATARSREPAERAGHRYLFLGQLIERKNPLGLVRAFQSIAQQDDTLTIAGKGPLESQLREIASTSVRMIGHTPYASIPNMLASHDTLVLPSHVEVWGLVANEALAAGLNVVVTEGSGVAPSIKHMRGAYVVEDSIASLAAGMVLSRAEWSGPIASPEILEHGPAEFASVFREAFDRVTAAPSA